MRLEHLPLSDLLSARHPGNPRKHELVGTAASIRRYGFRDPVGVDERTGRIAEGHGRVLALADMRDRGEDPPEHVEADESGEWLVPCVVGSSSDDAQEAGYLVSHNLASDRSSWDDDALAALDLDLPPELGEEEADPAPAAPQGEARGRGRREEQDPSQVDFPEVDEGYADSRVRTVPCPHCGGEVPA